MSKRTKKLLALKNKALKLSLEERQHLIEEYKLAELGIMLALAEEENAPLNVLLHGLIEANASFFSNVIQEYIKEELNKEFKGHVHVIGVERI